MKVLGKAFEGIWTALVTPFNDKGEIDWEAYRKTLKLQSDAGVDGVIPCGTTGESPTLSIEEKQKLITTALEFLNHTPVKVVAGTGSNDTDETVEFSKWASHQNVGGNKISGILVVTPYYNKPSQAGLEAHFKKVADAVSCPVILYNVPGRTGVSIAPETVAKLSKHPKIRGLKEATGNVALTSEIIDHFTSGSKDFAILSGDDATFLPLMAVGASGVISVVSNLYPKMMVELFQAAKKNDYTRAREIHQKLYPVFRDFFVEANPVPVKFAMESVGICNSAVRLPLVSLTPASQDKVLSAIAGLEDIGGRE